MTDTQSYPIDTKSLNKEAWNKRVAATLMASFLAEE